MYWRGLTTLVILTIAAFGSHAQAAAGKVQVVALGGEQVPHLPGGVNFSTFDFPGINAQGIVAFHSTLAGNVTSSNARAIWYGRGPSERGHGTMQ